MNVDHKTIALAVKIVREIENEVRAQCGGSTQHDPDLQARVRNVVHLIAAPAIRAP